ncbi:unnamed protein product [Pelagomonas calceolata]|uniref:C3H1-type domain-containing protein n=1 Tax=Pelagomonas calceolata TaxID=35677 RepID=A0A8J2WYY5_9STRA|nr:unnamed protein product [Pelagomonas calceolata]
MWNEPAANTDGSAPAETPEPPEPAYESKQDEPSGLDPRAADPRTPEAPAPAADEEDLVASLPADFAAFSLTQTHPRSGDAKAEPFEQQRQQGYKTRICIYGDKCPYGPGRCFFAHDESELRPPQARWWLPEYKTKPCRYAASECPFYADGRCQYAHTVRGPASRAFARSLVSRSSSTCGRRRRRRRTRGTRRACAATARARAPTA